MTNRIYGAGREIMSEPKPSAVSDKQNIVEQSGGTASDVALPLTSLIICSRNRPQFLTDLVESILQGHELPSEIVIIDDSDTPHATLAGRESCHTCQIRYHWTRSTGLGRANNDGIAAASHDVLVFTQDDTLVTPTWFGILVRALIKAGVRTVVTGQIRTGTAEAGGGFAPSTIAEEKPAAFQGRTGSDVLFLQNMAMYRSAAIEVGGFDPRLGPGTPFPAAEDNDFGYRLLEAGYQILYEPQAVTCHRAWRHATEYPRLYWNYGRGQGAYYAKHLSLHDGYMRSRLLADLRHYSLSVFQHALRSPRWAFSSLAMVLGLLYGVIRWGAAHWGDGS